MINVNTFSNILDCNGSNIDNYISLRACLISNDTVIYDYIFQINGDGELSGGEQLTNIELDAGQYKLIYFPTHTTPYNNYIGLTNLELMNYIDSQEVIMDLNQIT